MMKSGVPSAFTSRVRAVAAERAHERARNPNRGAKNDSLSARHRHARTRQRAQDDAGDQARRRCAARSRRQLVGHKFNQCEQRKDDGGGRGANPYERALQPQPTGVSAPRSHRRRSQRSQTD